MYTFHSVFFAIIVMDSVGGRTMLQIRLWYCQPLGTPYPLTGADLLEILSNHMDILNYLVTSGFIGEIPSLTVGCLSLRLHTHAFQVLV